MKDYIDVPISIKLSKAQKKKLEELSKSLDRPLSDLVREAIMALLGVYYGKKENALAKTMDEGVVRRER